jgi:hypothetical protein
MWFTETPWPPIAILGLAGGAFLFAALQTQRGKWLVAVGVCLVLALAVWFIERAIVTPGEQVEGNLLALVEAFQKNDEAGTLKHISTGPNSLGLAVLVKLAILSVDIDPDYRITDVQIQTQAHDTAATSHFRVNANIHMPTQGNLGHKPFRFLGKWRIEAGQWRLTEIAELDPINGKVLDRFHLLK